MNRKALIISNPGKPGEQNYCGGVNLDVSNYRQFLTSALGGTWLNSEIVHLDRPTQREVREQIVSLATFDYTFIVFTGHGYFSSKLDTTILELRENEELSSLELRSNANRRTIILDCCRKVMVEPLLEKAFAAKAERIVPYLDPTECRKYFDIIAEKCPKGLVVGYACKRNEVAGDSQSRGGYYSYGIMQSSIDWYEKKNDIDLKKSYSHFTTINAHDGAVIRVRQLSGGTQNPEIEKPRSEPYFPFAIMA